MTDDDFDSRWLDARCEALGVAPLDGDQVDALLALAGEAAHSSGDRRNAPLTCFVAGLRMGSSGSPVDAATIRGLPE